MMSRLCTCNQDGDNPASLFAAIKYMQYFMKKGNSPEQDNITLKEIDA